MSVRRRKDGRWQIDIVIWRGTERIRIRKAARAANKSEALAFERAERSKLEAGAPLGSAIPLFKSFSGEFLNTYAVTNNKPSEVASKRMIVRRHLEPAFGALRIDAIGPREIEAYKAAKLTAGVGPKTINNHLTVLRRMLAVAAEWGKLASVPHVRWLRTPAPDFDFLSFEEAGRLVTAADAEWRPMILLALRTGLRQGELLALRWEDVDLVAGRLLVRRSAVRGIIGTPKSGKAREVPLSDDAIAGLRSVPSRFRGRAHLLHGGCAAAHEGRVQAPALASLSQGGHSADRVAHAASHVCIASGHAWGGAQGHPGAARAQHDRDDDEVRAPVT